MQYSRTRETDVHEIVNEAHKLRRNHLTDDRVSPEECERKNAGK